MSKLKVGLLGCGAISDAYLKGAKEVFYDEFEIVSCADVIMERAKSKALEYDIPKAYTPEELLKDDEVDLVINITVPMIHEELTLKCLEAGKHVYSEKPLAVTREGVKKIMDKAKEKGLRVGCAPDTFMSAPMQTAKKMVEDGWIGEIVGVTAMCPMRGNEFWRPDPDFFYKKGAGPMLDMGAYYLNTLVSIIGCIKSVSAEARITFDTRTIKVPPRRGEKIEVEIPTFVSGVMQFENGAIGTLINSFDIWKSKMPYIEIDGAKGTLVLPDPNFYYGDVLMTRYGNNEWEVCPQLNEYANYMRGAAVADIALCLKTGENHRAGIELANHVTDVMLSFEEAAAAGTRKEITTRCEKPAGLWERDDTILWR